ncbi:hypothetical protein [Rhodococcoides fascians]|jgi:hypothetical protein|uniref:Uncharacterized protein n=1 Tax=Rhodococcoides fascians TaxID=1828 RepID=A0A143QKB4_RHOFA|nr:hypothetical protein [Rhodococcus fascians]AMY23248.1 hypothetical protein A3Q41_01945 [Rhodococcus fascians]OZC38813.1 MarR family transcriptional regulator [Rhodococcus fascians]
MRVTLQSTGDAPAPEVWERYMDPTVWKTWAPQIMGVEYRGERLDSDTSGRVLGPFGVPIDFEVHSVDEHSWTWAWSAWFQNRAIGVDLTHGVVSRPSGTRAWITIDGPLPLVLPYLPIAKFALGRLCAQ